MSLDFRGALAHETVLHATDLLAGLVARPEVADAWDEESSCAGMTVGGLAFHLVNQPLNSVRLMTAPQKDDAEVIGVLEHYARAAWVTEDLDGTFNRGIREGSDEQAAQGHAALVDLVEETRTALPGALAAAGPTTYIPWQRWALATEDFLVTRLMETVVHSDDLAASVGVPVPDFGPDVLDPVLRLLTALSVRRHGQDGVVRALTRPQRAPSSIAAF